MEKTKICLVIPSLQAGGMERVMSELLWHFSHKEKLEVNLILYGKTREVFFKIPESVVLHKPVFRFRDKYRFFHTLKTLAFLRKTIKKIGPSTILSYGEYWNNFVLLSVLGLRFPVYVSDRSQPDKSLGRLHDSLRRWLYPRAKGVILQSETAREIFLKNIRHKNIAVIGNPIRRILEGSSDMKREKSILMVGRLIKSKHQDRLIEIFSKLSLTDWKLLIVGYDHLKQKHTERLEALIKALNLEGRVMLLGKQSGIEDFYLKSSIFAFTSSSEGFPNVIGEAMSAGLPVVSYDCVAGPSEMITDGRNGFLVPLFDDEQFRERLDLLMSDEEMRKEFGKHAFEDIQGFSISVIGDKYLSFILNRNNIENTN
ncbi:MAG: glycosyltransferase [Bacteroidota bacterium]|nr:glycosyltransferase [Bacteroidota bacterium]